jgi:hypothetical protein
MNHRAARAVTEGDSKKVLTPFLSAEIEQQDNHQRSQRDDATA